MLGREEIIGKLHERLDEMRLRFSVRRIGLFGSYLKGTASAKSDIDLVVDFEQPTFDHYMELKFYLESLFERPVDLVIADAVKPRLKPVIKKEIIYA